MEIGRHRHHRTALPDPLPTWMPAGRRGVMPAIAWRCKRGIHDQGITQNNKKGAIKWSGGPSGFFGDLEKFWAPGSLRVVAQPLPRCSSGTFCPAPLSWTPAFWSPHSWLRVKPTTAWKLLGPTRLDYHWQARAGAGFDAQHFQINWDRRQATCPTVKTSLSWTPTIELIASFENGPNLL